MALQQVRPSQTQYSAVLPTAIPASESTRRYLPNNGALFTPGGANIIRIPINGATFLDCTQSFLSFRVTNGTDAIVHPDGNAWAFFERYSLEGPDSTLIDDINQVGALMNLVCDYSVGEDHRSTVGHANQGMPRTVGLANSGGAPAAGDQYKVDKYSDAKTLAAASAVGTFDGGSRQYVLPMVGLLASRKYLPVQFMSGQGLQIVLRLANGAHALKEASALTSPYAAQDAAAAAAVADYQIDNIAYVATMLNFNSDFLASFEQALAAGITIHFSSYSHHQGNTAASTAPRVTINERAKSIKSLYSVLRSQAVNDVSEWTCSGRHWNTTTQWNYKIGGLQVPSQKVAVSAENPAESLGQTYKAMGFNQASKEAGSGVVDADNYVEVTASTAGAAGEPQRRGTFAIGYDMEAFPQDMIMSGTNTSTNALPVELELVTAAVNLRVDSWALYDAAVSMGPNGVLVYSK